MRDDELPDLTRGNRVTVADGDAMELQPEAQPQATITRACFACKSEFQPKRDWQKFCSRRCRTRGWRERKESSTAFYFGA
jgi:hypothetical protein